LKVYYASTGDGVRKAVRALLEAMDWQNLLPRNEDLLLKVNLTWDYLRPGVDTSPWVVDAFVETVKGHVGKIILGESSQVLVDASRAFVVTRMKDVADRHGLEWHDFSKNEWVPVSGGDISFSIPRICTRLPVVSVPVVKTHYRSVISVAVKHLYGCLDDNRHNYHYRLADYAVAVNSVIPVLLTLADGTFSLEGGGPKPGIPKRTDFVAASVDRIALDYSVSKVMGIDPLSVETTVRGNGMIGTFENLEEVCLPPLEDPPSFEFLPAVPNFVARVEKILRHRRKNENPGKDGPFLGILKFGAKKWYNMAYHLLGQAGETRRIIEESYYGPQWLGLREPE